jgi:dGTPase
MSPPPAPQTAPYACQPERSRGRLVAEPDSPTRSCFQRDRDRIIHCGAFRRLKYKTQVFVYHEGDYYRTRLSHSLEVAQIARSIARALALNEDLAEALALAHDLGHTPFGHAGEKALDEAMAPFGGFDHNEQTFRIVTLLERRYAAFDGLNLTWETLEGTVKHNGPLVGPQAAVRKVPATVARFCEAFDLELDSQPGAEAQVASLADDIAYNSHDIDDGLRAGLFGLDDLKALPLVGPVVVDLLAAYPGIEHGRLVHETVRRVIDAMVTDVLAETGRRLNEAAPGEPDELRALGRPVVAFSEAMREKDRALKGFLFEGMYRHYRVNRMGSKVRRVVRDLFAHYLAEPDCLPDEWRDQAVGSDAPTAGRLVADYIAGMTDRYALAEHHKLFDIYTKT